MNIPILSPLFGWIIKFLYDIFGQNYLLTLFLFALIVKVILFPLGVKQQKNSIKQAKMRPKEMAIRKKYAGRTDKVTQQKLNEEIMKLYQEENINPMSGCLPLLIQLPIIFALYGVITKPLTYISSLGKETVAALTKAFSSVAEKTVAYPEIDIIKTIAGGGDKAEAIKESLGDITVSSWDSIVTAAESLKESFTIFSLDLTVTPEFKLNIYILIPILTFVFAFLSQKIIRKFTYQSQQIDEAQAKSLAMMDWMMPLMSVWISFSVSSAIAVYWIFQNILSALQQIIMYKMFPVPVITEEQIKQAELELKGKATKAKPNVKPVNYEIDDYDKTPADEKISGKVEKKVVIGKAKTGISPKFRQHMKSAGKAPKAKRQF